MASPPSSPSPTSDRLELSVGYRGDEPTSSSLYVERDGTYVLERRGDPGDGSEILTKCTGALPLATNSALWTAAGRVEFVPYETGFQRSIAAPPRDAGGRANYSISKQGGNRVPPDEAHVQSLLPVIRTSINIAEDQSQLPGAPCVETRKSR